MNKFEPQKIYIDVDEEITTVIDHLSKIKSNDVIIVVPQHALLLQSVVNLKLLSVEARKRHKKIVLMTRDEDGISFATRAGIDVQPFVSEEDERLIYSEESKQQIQKEVPRYAEAIMNNETTQRTDNMGSQSFFDSDVSRGMSVSGLTSQKVYPDNQETKVNIPKSLRQSSDANIGQSELSSIAQNNTSARYNRNINSKAQSTINMNMGVNNSVENNQQLANSGVNLNQEKQGDYVTSGQHSQQDYELGDYEQTLKRARVNANNQDSGYNRTVTIEKSNFKSKSNRKKKKSNDINMPSNTGIAVKGFVIGGLIIILIVLIIAILPKTSISITPKEITIDEVMEMTAKTAQSASDAERRLIPARLIDKDVTFTKTFEATGTGDVTAQKAQGLITIFNEYNDKPQPLVATTRFLAEDGSLFRLVNPVTVPGKNGDDPGRVDALVIADKEGKIGNIGPSRFSIPGFKDSSKKNKFYGISEKSMVGGGAGGTGVSVVTEEDIKKAELEMDKELKQYITEQLTGIIRPDDEVLTEESFEYDIIRSESSVSTGTMTDQFMYEIVSHVKALVFSKNDIIAVMDSNVSGKYPQYIEEGIELNVDYKNVKTDFENEEIEFKAHGTANVVATIDVESFSEDIMGEKHDDLLEIIEDEYKEQIEKITIESVLPGFPVFVASRISKLDFMTDIQVETE